MIRPAKSTMQSCQFYTVLVQKNVRLFLSAASVGIQEDRFASTTPAYHKNPLAHTLCNVCITCCTHAISVALCFFKPTWRYAITRFPLPTNRSLDKLHAQTKLLQRHPHIWYSCMPSRISCNTGGLLRCPVAPAPLPP